ncbi:MAG: DUF72 domain-containing protein [Thermodesulfovibrionia bacterium]|nr:DUF72 domain-containing protein [Thermodesulfovibrionia bacterium]
MPKCKIGCSGFLYDSWKDTFYPEGLTQKRWLSYYVKKLDSVELSITFYRLLKKEAFERWYSEAPPGFAFCLKGSRFVTHIKKLKDVTLPLETFFNVTLPLHEKFEVVIWQFPLNLKVNIKNLEGFIEVISKYPVRHVFEFKQASWLNKKVIKLLSESNIAVCMADSPEFLNDLPVTADFVYIQRHGPGGNYALSYSPEQIKDDANKIKEFLKKGKDVYIFFNNDANAYAPQNAMELKRILDKTLPHSLMEHELHKKVSTAAKPEETVERKAVIKKTVEKKKVATKKKVIQKTAIKKKNAAKQTTKKPAAKPAKRKTAQKAKSKKK